MAVIALEGMHFYAHHGFYEEERIIGGNYIVDIQIDTNTTIAAATDDLYKTINYETVYRICQSEMRKPSKLLEALAQRIISKISEMFGKKAKNIKIRIKKLAPPLGGRVDAAFIEIEQGGGRGRSKKGKSHQEETFPEFAELAFDDFDDFDDFGEDDDLGGLGLADLAVLGELADLEEVDEIPSGAMVFEGVDANEAVPGEALPADLNLGELLNATDMDDADMEDIDLEDINLDDIDLEDLGDIDLSDLGLDDIDLSDLNLDDIDLEGLDLDGIDFDE